MKPTARIRRTPQLNFYVRDVVRPDVGLLLRGSIEIRLDSRVFVVTPADQREHELSDDDLTTLIRTTQRQWTTVAEATDLSQVRMETIESLLKRGLLVADECDTDSDKHDPLDSSPTALGWNRYAAQYHVMSRWLAQLPDESARNDPSIEETVARHGPPPGEFHTISSDYEPVELPVIDPEHGVFEILKKRETVRDFDTRRQVSFDNLSLLLYYTFGCHGTLQLAEHVVALKKCSPSGGALHPVEAYPLVLNVEGVPTGLYHYNVKQHTLEVISQLNDAEAKELAIAFTSNQDYFGSAHLLIVMTGRFDRLFWKYRNHSKAYKVMFLDAGHLSQTFYLLCTELGLGPFFTAAICDTAIEKQLGLVDYEEGALGVCGCGPPGAQMADRFDYVPFVPHSG